MIRTQSEVAALWLEALLMPPSQLAKCLTVHTLAVPDGNPFSARPAVRVKLPSAQAAPQDFAEVLLDILQLLVSNHAKHVHVSVHGHGLCSSGVPGTSAELLSPGARHAKPMIMCWAASLPSTPRHLKLMRMQLPQACHAAAEGSVEALR